MTLPKIYPYRIFLLASFFFCASTFAQHNTSSKGRIFWNADIGINQSIGEDKEDYIQGSSNSNLSVGYYKQKRFENPGLRLKAGVLYSKNNDFFIGLQSGLYCRFGETYGGDDFTLYSVPFQIRVLNSIYEKGPGKFLLEAAIGANFFELIEETRTYKSGPLLNGGMVYMLRSKLTLSFGYEYQVDHSQCKVQADPIDGTIAEVVQYKQRRQQLYFSVGIKR